jgi:hypothetical protein
MPQPCSSTPLWLREATFRCKDISGPQAISHLIKTPMQSHHDHHPSHLTHLLSYQRQHNATALDAGARKHTQIKVACAGHGRENLVKRGAALSGQCMPAIAGTTSQLRVAASVQEPLVITTLTCQEGHATLAPACNTSCCLSTSSQAHLNT